MEDSLFTAGDALKLCTPNYVFALPPSQMIILGARVFFWGGLLVQGIHGGMIGKNEFISLQKSIP